MKDLLELGEKVSLNVYCTDYILICVYNSSISYYALCIIISDNLFAVNTIESDPTAEISHFQIRIASFALILLHEDMLTYSTDNTQTVVLASVQQMQNTAKYFFDNTPFVTGSGNRSFENVRSLFDKACRQSHLR